MASVPWPKDKPTLEQLVKLVRLKDVRYGIQKGREADRLTRDPEGQKPKGLPELLTLMELGFRVPDEEATKPFDWIGLMAHLFEGSLTWWDDRFADEMRYARRFTELLGELKLNVSAEMKELTSIQSENEIAVQRANRWFKTFSETRKKDGMEDVSAGLKRVSKRLDEFNRRLDDRTTDAIALLSRTVSSAASQELFELFTRDPST